MLLQVAFHFLWLSDIPLHVCTTFLPFDGHLLLFMDICFYVLAIVNSAAVDIEVHVFFKLCFSPEICPGVGLLDNMVALF